MPTIRLYRAVKELRDAEAIHNAATFNGNFGPPKSLGHGSPLVLRLREANVELSKAMSEAEEIMKAPDDRSRAVRVRIAGEQDICRFMLQSLVEQGCELQTYDGEEETGYTKDWTVLYANAFDTDELYVNVRWAEGQEEPDEGWIHCIYGNSAPEMISDHTTNLQKLLTPTFKYIRSYYDHTYIVEE